MSKPEILCDVEVHPAASIFPLMEGDAFQSLVDSIAVHGVQNPIVCSGNVLIDGRNRLRAVHHLREQGKAVDLPAVQWQPNGIGAAEWITAQNLDRRHLTEDARAMIGAKLAKLIKAEAKEAKKGSQFTSDTGKAAATKKGEPPVTTDSPSPRKRDRKKSEERTTAAKAAKAAKVSTHKMKQAMAVERAVEAGEVAPEVVSEIVAGKKKCRDVLPAKPKSKQAKGGYASIDDEIRVEANRSWSRLRDKFTPGDEHKKLRAVMVEIIHNEQKQFEKK